MPSSAEDTHRAIDAVFGPKEGAGHVTSMSQEALETPWGPEDDES
jgi:hypothetical protein